MPYIEQEARNRLCHSGKPKTTGELNYTFTKALLTETEPAIISILAYDIARAYIADKLPDNYRYQDINDILGAAFGAAMEYERRVPAWNRQKVLALSNGMDHFYKTFAVPYEEKKIVANGDLDEYKAKPVDSDEDTGEAGISLGQPKNEGGTA